MASDLEILDFYRPDGSRKNLFISNIPPVFTEDEIVETLTETFGRHGLVHGVQVYRSPGRLQPLQASNNPLGACFYAFVSLFSSMAASKAKMKMKHRITLGNSECKITYAKRKKVLQDTQPLHLAKCYELANHYLGFNGWYSSIKVLEEDKESTEEQGERVRYVCLVTVDITGQGLHTEGMGAWEEAYSKTDFLSRSKAVCKAKKISFQRAMQNAFTKVLIIVLGNGKVSVEIDTTKPELSIIERQTDATPTLLKVNELDEQPIVEATDDDLQNEGDIVNINEDTENMDDINLQILQELEEVP